MEITSDGIAAERRRRAENAGLARVMRASQSATLAETVTDGTRALLAAQLDQVAAVLSHPVAVGR
jgi:hypothetical protein